MPIDWSKVPDSGTKPSKIDWDKIPEEKQPFVPAYQMSADPHTHPVSDWFRDLKTDIEEGKDLTAPGKLLRLIHTPATHGDPLNVLGGAMSGVAEVGHSLSPRNPTVPNQHGIDPNDYINRLNEFGKGVGHILLPAAMVAAPEAMVPSAATFGPIQSGASHLAKAVGAPENVQELAGNVAAAATPLIHAGLPKVGEFMQEHAPQVGKVVGTGAAAAELIHGHASPSSILAATLGRHPVAQLAQTGTRIAGKGLSALGDIPLPHQAFRVPDVPTPLINTGSEIPKEPLGLPAPGIPEGQTGPSPDDIVTPAPARAQAATAPPPPVINPQLPESASPDNNIEPLIKTAYPALNENTAKTRVDPNTGAKPTNQQVLEDQPGYVPPTEGRTFIAGPEGIQEQAPPILPPKQLGTGGPPLIQTQLPTIENKEIGPADLQKGIQSVSLPVEKSPINWDDVEDDKAVQGRMRDYLDQGQQNSEALGKMVMYAGSKPDVGKTTGSQYGDAVFPGEKDNTDLLPWAQTPWGDNAGARPLTEPQTPAEKSVKPLVDLPKKSFRLPDQTDVDGWEKLVDEGKARYNYGTHQYDFIKEQ